MTPAQAIALQQQRPRLPDGWGGTLRRPAQAPAASPAPGHTDTSYLTDRLLRRLYQCAEAGERLPSAAALCAQLRHTASRPERAVKAALESLQRRGAIERRGASVVLVASGRVVQVR